MLEIPVEMTVRIKYIKRNCVNCNGLFQLTSLTTLEITTSLLLG